MKKIIILSVLLALSLFMFNCGGGSGSSSSPKGENPGEPSIVQLLPAQFVAQTNSIITLHAKVLDGNGAPVKNETVWFINLSPIGDLSDKTARTNSTGIASVTLKSTTSGFATVQVEVNKGTGQVRVRKTVYFSLFDMALPTPPLPTLRLDVDGNNDGVFDELDDITLFQNASDNQVLVRATVFDGFGDPVFGSVVTFGADSTEATFPLGNTKTTDSIGQASVIVQVDPSILRNFTTTLNITASADNGAANMTTLFLQPVVIQTINVFANPTTVESGGTSTITAQVLTNAGTPAPDGSTVNFTVISGSGSVEPFAQTTDGLAEAKFTAPEVTSNTSATIRASAVGKIGQVTVSVIATITEPPPIAALAISPAAATVTGLNNPDGDPSDDVTFVITGGVSPYSVTSSLPGVISSPGNLGAGVNIFTVDSQAVSSVTNVTLTILDSAGSTVTATVTVNPVFLSISLNRINVIGLANPDGDTGDDITFTVTGGVGPYIVTSSNPALTTDGTWAGDASPFSETFDPNNVGSTTTVTLTVVDNAGSSASATLIVFPVSTDLVISLNRINVIGIGVTGIADGNISDDVTFTVTGGTPPYIVTSNNPALTPDGTWAGAADPFSQLFDPNRVGAETDVTFTVVDNAGNFDTASLKIFPISTGLLIEVDKKNVIGLTNPDGTQNDNVTFTVTGGTPPYLISASGDNTCVLPNGPWQILVSGGTRNIDPEDTTTCGGGGINTITLTATDNIGSVATPTTFNVYP